jgi:hypothetical protein
MDKQLYKVQLKTTKTEPWVTCNKFDDLEKARQCCLQKMRQHRGKPGTMWAKSRVVVGSGDLPETQIYP